MYKKARVMMNGGNKGIKRSNETPEGRTGTDTRLIAEKESVMNRVGDLREETHRTHVHYVHQNLVAEKEAIMNRVDDLRREQHAIHEQCHSPQDSSQQQQQRLIAEKQAIMDRVDDLRQEQRVIQEQCVPRQTRSSNQQAAQESLAAEKQAIIYRVDDLRQEQWAIQDQCAIGQTSTPSNNQDSSRRLLAEKQAIMDRVDDLRQEQQAIQEQCVPRQSTNRNQQEEEENNSSSNTIEHEINQRPVVGGGGFVDRRVGDLRELHRSVQERNVQRQGSNHSNHSDRSISKNNGEVVTPNFGTELLQQTGAVAAIGEEESQERQPDPELGRSQDHQENPASDVSIQVLENPTTSGGGNDDDQSTVSSGRTWGRWRRAAKNPRGVVVDQDDDEDEEFNRPGAFHSGPRRGTLQAVDPWSVEGFMQTSQTMARQNELMAELSIEIMSRNSQSGDEMDIGGDSDDGMDAAVSFADSAAMSSVSASTVGTYTSRSWFSFRRDDQSSVAMSNTSISMYPHIGDGNSTGDSTLTPPRRRPSLLGTIPEDIAEEEARERSKMVMRRRIAAISIMVLVVLAIGISLGVVLGSGDGVSEMVPTLYDPMLSCSEIAHDYLVECVQSNDNIIPVPECAQDFFMELRFALAPSITLSDESVIPCQDDDNRNTLLSLLLVAAATSENPTMLNLGEYYLLSILYVATHGWEWTEQNGWLSPFVNPCLWQGIKCVENTHNAPPAPANTSLSLLSEASSTKIVQIDLTNNNVMGTLPTELGTFEALTSLCFAHNFIRGSIPSELGNLADLATLKLTHNRLTSTIPTELTSNPKLRGLWLDFNALTGVIPTQIGNMELLENLHLESNRLGGSLPTEFGNTKNLRAFRVGANFDLLGAVPSEFGSLVNLEELSMWGGSFTPAPIPEEFWGLPNIRSLQLNEIGFIGKLSPMVSNLTTLEELSLGENRLTGTLVTELGLLTKLTSLDISFNQIEGMIPTELGECVQLSLLYLFGNDLTGTIPTELGRLTSLRELVIDSNNIDGAIPAEICALAAENGGQLQTFHFDVCAPEISLPSCIESECLSSRG